MDRREFIKHSIGGMAVVAIGSRLPWLERAARAAEGPPPPPTQTLQVTVTDILKDMVNQDAIITSKCYFWVYQMSLDGVPIPIEYPGPAIAMIQGDSVNISITNALDEDHAFTIPGVFDSGPIAPGDTATGVLTATTSGAFLYFDNLNTPVNRVMGLHGAFLVRPAAPAPGHKFTPYDNPTAAVQELYDDFGNSAHFPGLAWEDADNAPWSFDPTRITTPPFRQYLWLHHQASPNLFAQVGSLAPGVLFDPTEFVNAFLNDPFVPNAPNGNNRTPQYFMINGQSGFFSHFNPVVTPMGRVGEPVVIHALNAGLMVHSLHIHANHVYLTSVDHVVQDNPIWVDTFTLLPTHSFDYTLPFMRQPDIGTVRGIGFPEQPLTTIAGFPVYPPVEEFQVFIPPLGTTAKDAQGNDVELGQRMSPLCYPMHDHSEPTQTAQGGNYPNGSLSGVYFTGDRNVPGFLDFPTDADFLMMYQNVRGVARTEDAAPPIGVPLAQ